LAVGVLWLVAAVLAGDLNPFSLAIGLDNRLSTSKLQVLLWTACVGFVYAMIYADRVIVFGHVDAIAQIPQNVLFALGLSVTSAVAAKAITSSQVAADPDTKDVAATPSYDPSALVREDGATTASLTKVQVLFWTVIAIVVYVNSAFHDLTTIVPCTGPACAFPDIDTTLMIFMGLGHATYIGGKLVGNSTPQLSKVVATGWDPKTQLPSLALSGGSLGTSGTVLVSGDPLDGSFVDSWTATLIKIRLDPALGPWSPGDLIALAVNVAGALSPAITYVFAPPATQPPAAPPATPPPAAPPATPPTATPASPANGTAPVRGLLHGLDVSYAQGMAIDWDAVHRSGLAEFVYARATYAANPANDDPNFGRNHDECKRLGIPFGAYHFFRFTVPAADQAAHFLSAIDGRTGTLCPAVDVEELSGRGDSVAQMIESLSAFIGAVEKALGRAMLIYTNRNTWNTALGGSDAFAGHRLWVANITEEPDTPPAMPAGFPDWTIHQYSSTGRIPATDGSFGNVDLNVLKGPLANIEAGLAPPPVQAPVPVPGPASATPGPLARLRYDGVAKKLEGSDAQGRRTFSYDAHNDSVAANAWRPDAGCPPGIYRLLAPEPNDPKQASTPQNDWIGEGLWFIPIDGIPGHEGIGIHGGGTCKTPPNRNALAPRQGWCPTENCIRVQNEDLAVLAKLPLNGKPIEVYQSPA
jgi:GH25 family lysozyme M1 (1,4-beta-N-acetylmuramidase)